MTAVGSNIPHDSAHGHVTGESVYIDDIAPLPGELLVDFFYSPLAHARIASIDLSEAAAVPGVVALFTHEDLAHNRCGPILQDEPVLADGEVTYIGQAIVVIAALDREAIRLAKAAVRIEFEELDPNLTIEDAISHESFLGEPRVFRKGDVGAILAASDHVIEGTFVCGGQDHFYLESQAALVVPEEFDTLVVHSSTQHPTEVQEIVALLLGLGINQVNCVTRRMGGAFGGKESQATHPAVMAALVAHKTKRPARIVYNKDDDMIATGKRHGFRNRYRVGFTKEGEITALKVDLYSDGGAYADLSTSVMGRAMCHVDNAYYLPAYEISGRVCRTNKPPNTAFRGFGGPQGAATIECIMEEIGNFLGKDALDIRRKNVYGVGERDVTPYGQTVEHNTLPQLFDELTESSDYRSRREAVERFNERSRTHLRGLSMTSVKFGISFNTKFLNQASALVNIYLDGTVQVSTGATEMGQGVNTKIRQIVADELGVPVETVRMLPTSTERSNNASATAASSGSDLNGAAAVDACGRLRERLTTVAAEHLKAQEDNIEFANGEVYSRENDDQRMSFADLVHHAYLERVSLGERGFYATPHLHYDAEANLGRPFLYFTNGVAVSEVEIDRFTGQMRLLRSDLLMDIGRPINPGIDRGQITGGFVQGYGWLTNEELRYSTTGILWSHSPTTYKIPNISDVPEVFNVDWIDNPTNTINVRRSKAVGEPPLLLGISVWTAIKHALTFVSGDEVARLHAPATIEEIVMRLAHYTRSVRSIQGDGLQEHTPQIVVGPK
ncbi:xanthine dehydrogenase molybdopterin binding subunit [soil metagenome]